MKKVLAWLLVVTLWIGLLPTGVTAAVSSPVTGTCGYGLSWALDADGTLTNRDLALIQRLINEWEPTSA